MANIFDQYQPHNTYEELMAKLNDPNVGHLTSTRQAPPVAPTAPTSLAKLPGNTMGMSPDQEAAIRQWSATGGQAGPAGTTTTQTGGDPLAFIKEWQSTKPATRESFQQLAQELKTRFGIDRAPGGNGPSNNEFTINGEKVKVMGAEDSANPTWFAYGSDDGWRPGGGSGGGLPGGYSLTGANNLASFDAPGLVAPWTQEFQAPDPSQIAANDPSYKFIRDEALQAVSRKNASIGNIYTGGTLKDLQDRASGIASTFDDKYYNRAWDKYGMDRGTFWGNQNNTYSKLSGYAGMGQDAANQSGNFAGQYADNAQTGATNIGNLTTNQGNANAAGTIAGQNASNQAGSAVANGAGAFDWSSLFRRQPSAASMAAT